MESFDIKLSDGDFATTFLVRPIESAGKTVYEIWGEDNHWISVSDHNGKQTNLLLTGKFSDKNISDALVGKVSDAILQHFRDDQHKDLNEQSFTKISG